MDWPSYWVGYAIGLAAGAIGILMGQWFGRALYRWTHRKERAELDARWDHQQAELERILADAENYSMYRAMASRSDRNLIQ